MLLEEADVDTHLEQLTKGSLVGLMVEKKDEPDKGGLIDVCLTKSLHKEFIKIGGEIAIEPQWDFYIIPYSWEEQHSINL